MNPELLDKAIQYPSKWDIIPIHQSDRAAFKFCRRQWNWSSPSRSNLIPRTQVHGITEPLWFGGGIHYALQKFYDPALHQDPSVTWLAWFDLQWKGGYVTLSEVPEFADRNPTLTEVGVFKVDGLQDVLPFVDDEVEEHFMELRDLGEGMMKFYKNYAETYDNFEVIAVEHEFSVPILNPSTGEPLYMVDKREMPENYTPDLDAQNIYGRLVGEPWWDSDNEKWLYHKQVHARGRQDIIIKELEHGRYGIRDYKTTKSIDEDYFRHLELDEQCTTYLWGGEIEAKMFDLPYKKLEFIDYVAIYKGYPRPPTITSRGLPSLDRKNESTTARLFEQTIDVMGLRPIFEADVKMQSYYQWLLEQGDKRYIWPKEVWRNQIQRQNAGARIYYEAIDMLSDPRLYPNPTKNYGCLNCRFRAPCIAAETGADFRSILEDGYMPNWDR